MPTFRAVRLYREESIVALQRFLIAFQPRQRGTAFPQGRYKVRPNQQQFVEAGDNVCVASKLAECDAAIIQRLSEVRIGLRNFHE